MLYMLSLLLFFMSFAVKKYFKLFSNQNASNDDINTFITFAIKEYFKLLCNQTRMNGEINKYVCNEVNEQSIVQELNDLH